MLDDFYDLLDSRACLV